MQFTQNKYFLISVLLLMVSAFFACNKEDEPLPGDPVINGAVKVPTDQHVTLDVKVNNGSGLQWDMYDAIGLFLIREGGNADGILAENSNVKARFDGNGWVIDDSVKIDDGRWIAYAYWPYDESVRVNDMSVSVGTGINYLIGQTGHAFSYTENHISLVMQKLMSAVRVNIRALDPNVEQYVQRIAIQHTKNSLPTGGTLSLIDEHLNYEMYGSYVQSGLDKLLTGSFTTASSFRVLPRTQGAFTRYTENNLNDDLELHVRVNGKDYSAALSSNVSMWAPGKQYDINVVMTSVGMVIDNVGCSPWTTQEVVPIDMDVPNPPKEN